MGLFLIAETSLLEWIAVILQVAFGLGMVIFVHELGHFLVAKACGVQCDKFYIGFDVGGYKLAKFQWGETEYGIGIVPLGGYVKMLGQDDNPANAAREMERARLAKERTSEAEPSDEGEPQYELNPRSYLAKSVPQRMAIISAGVIMNVIFAFLFAAIAYAMGVNYVPSIVSETVPGSPAWQVGLQPGDEIVKIGDVEKPRFMDLKYGVSLGDVEQGVTLVVERPDSGETQTYTLKPETRGPLPTIGVVPARSLKLYDELAAYPNTPAAAAEPELKPGDELVAVNGQPLESYTDLAAVLVREQEKPLTFTVRRMVGKGSDAESERAQVTVPPNPMKRLGLVMKIGAITAVQENSPAARAGLKPSDFLLQLNGEPIGDPVTLPDRLRRMAQAGEPTATLTVERASNQGPSETLEIPVPLRVPVAAESSPIPGTPLSAPAIGIAYRVLNRVHAVEPGSPAAQAGLVAGDEVIAARFVPAKPLTDEEKIHVSEDKVLYFSEKEPNWPAFVEQLQWLAPNMQVELTVRSGDKQRKVQLEPVASDEWFSAQRGFALMPVSRVREAESLGEALALGARETKESLLMVYRFLQKLTAGDIPITMLGGPGTIAQAAGMAAFEGIPTLLIFLTVLSANLAVVNFLPIPVLDGGHMVFLILEGILRRPVSEKIVVAMQALGLAFIVALMLFVISLDVGLIPRGF